MIKAIPAWVRNDVDYYTTRLRVFFARSTAKKRLFCDAYDRRFEVRLSDNMTHGATFVENRYEYPKGHIADLRRENVLAEGRSIPTYKMLSIC